MNEKITAGPFQIIAGNKIFDCTAENIAFIFSEMGSDEQAKFFSEVAKLAKDWDSLGDQINWIAMDDELTEEGKSFISELDQYVNGERRDE